MATTRIHAARAALLTLVAVVGSATTATAAETLRWRLRPGETLRYEFRQKNQIKVKAGAAAVSDNTTELTFDLTWKVKTVAGDGAAEITLVVDRVRSEIRLGTQSIKYDSNGKAGDDPGSQALKTVYSAAVGHDYTVKIDARGRLTEAKVPAGVTDALRGSPFLATADGGSILSETGLKNLFAQLIPVLPETPVDKGATWSSALDLPVPPMRLSLTYKEDLTTLDAASARVVGAIDTAIKSDPNSPFKVDVKGQSGTRTVTLDVKNGRVTASTVKQSIALSLGFMDRKVEQEIALDEEMKLVP